MRLPFLPKCDVDKHRIRYKTRSGGGIHHQLRDPPPLRAHKVGPVRNVTTAQWWRTDPSERETHLSLQVPGEGGEREREREQLASVGDVNSGRAARKPEEKGKLLSLADCCVAPVLNSLPHTPAHSVCVTEERWNAGRGRWGGCSASLLLIWSSICSLSLSLPPPRGGAQK